MSLNSLTIHFHVYNFFTKMCARLKVFRFFEIKMKGRRDFFTKISPPSIRRYVLVLNFINSNLHAYLCTLYILYMYNVHIYIYFCICSQSRKENPGHILLLLSCKLKFPKYINLKINSVEISVKKRKTHLLCPYFHGNQATFKGEMCVEMPYSLTHIHTYMYICRSPSECKTTSLYGHGFSTHNLHTSAWSLYVCIQFTPRSGTVALVYIGRDSSTNCRTVITLNQGGGERSNYARSLRTWRRHTPSRLLL